MKPKTAKLFEADLHQAAAEVLLPAIEAFHPEERYPEQLAEELARIVYRSDAVTIEQMAAELERCEGAISLKHFQAWVKEREGAGSDEGAAS